MLTETTFNFPDYIMMISGNAETYVYFSHKRALCAYRHGMELLPYDNHYRSVWLLFLSQTDTIRFEIRDYCKGMFNCT